MKLGASTIAYGPHDLQLETGESLSDTERVLANYLDILVIRTNEPWAEMRSLAAQQKMAVVNAMSVVALAVAKTAGLRLTLVTPMDYGLSDSLLDEVSRMASEDGGVVEQHHDMSPAERC
jgi:ornithine carbamoyltransferase